MIASSDFDFSQFLNFAADVVIERMEEKRGREMENAYAEMSNEELRQRVRSLKALRSHEGRGRGPDAAHVRSHVKAELARIRAELRKRGDPPVEKSVKNLGWNSTAEKASPGEER